MKFDFFPIFKGPRFRLITFKISALFFRVLVVTLASKWRTQLKICLNLMKFPKMDRIFMISNLLDGEYDYETKELKFSLKRYVWNSFLVFLSFFIFLNHLIMLLVDDDCLKNKLFTFKFFNGKSERVSNFTVGVAVFCAGYVIFVYRRFHKDQSQLDSMRFLFCLDQNKMEEDFHLNPKMAKQQVNLQRIFLKCASIWNQMYFIALGFLSIKLAYDDLSKREFLEEKTYYLIKSSFYVFLLIQNHAMVARTFIVFGHMNLSCIYFHHYLQTLIIELQKSINLKGNLFVKKLIKVNKSYNKLISNQKKLNHHFGKAFYFFHVFNFFTVLYPINILFLDPNETFLIVFQTADYFCIVFLFFLPVMLTSSIFIRTNLQFVKNCYTLSPYLTKINHKIKMLGIYTLNYHSDSISFNFKQFINYSLHFFFSWSLESISLVLLFYATFSGIKP